MLVNTAILSPQEIIRKCHIMSHTPGSQTLALPWPLTSKGAVEDEGIPEADHFICRLVVSPQCGLFYKFTWEVHRGHAVTALPGDWSRWEVGISNTVLETPKPKTRIAKKWKAGIESEGEESDFSLLSPSKRLKPMCKAPTRSRLPAKKPHMKVILLHFCLFLCLSPILTYPQCPINPHSLSYLLPLSYLFPFTCLSLHFSEVLCISFYLYKDKRQRLSTQHSQEG